MLLALGSSQVDYHDSTSSEVLILVSKGSAGGLGRHLGVFSCTLLIVGHIVGTGTFSTPSSILSSTGSVGASLMLWVLGFILSFCGLFIWLEFGTMFPRSGGEKVYLEAVYTKPKYLVTVVFAMNTILLGFTANGCIVCTDCKFFFFWTSDKHYVATDKSSST